MRILFFIMMIFISSLLLADNKKGLIELSGYYYEKGEYYNAITELMRFQHLNPADKRIPESIFLMARSYYMGGNIEKSQLLFKKCYYEYPKTPYGGMGLYYSGVVRLLNGAPYFAMRDFQEYIYVYKGHEYYEDAIFNLCAAYGLTENYNRSLKGYSNYKDLFPDGKYSHMIDSRLKYISGIENREKKSPFLAGLSSALIPGTGYFYSGKYELGLFSMLTNGALIYLVYDSYKKKKNLNLILFTLAEISFYNYSIVGSVRSAREYNSSFENSEFLMGIRKEF